MVLDKAEYSMIKAEISLKIQYYRKLAGITQEELAKYIDMSASYISELESPKKARCPSIKTLIKISKALSVPPSKFLEIDSFEK